MKLVFAKKVLAAAAFAGLAATSLSAQSALITSLIIPGENTVQDSDVERIIRDGRVITSGNFQVGDIIESILRFSDANGAFISDSLPAPYQLTAYSRLQIAAILPDETPFNGVADDVDPNAFTFVFAGGFGDGVTMAQIYENNVDDPTRAGTQALYSQGATPDGAIGVGTGGIARAISGDLLATIGLGEAGDYWIAGNSILNIATVASQPAGGTQVPAGSIGVSVLTNPGALPITKNGISCADGGLHDICGTASAYKKDTGVNAGWLLSSNTEMRFNSVVPEPTSLALLGGLALAGGIAARRRKV